MVALRTRPAAAFSSGPFWLSALCVLFSPTSIGYQDLAAFFARQPGVSERWQEHLIASPFGTIHAATFSFARPIGTAMPDPPDLQPVNFDPRSLDVRVWSGDGPPMARPAIEIAYPTINRRLKGDRLPLPQSSPPSSGADDLPHLQPIDAPSAPTPVHAPVPDTTPRLKDAELHDTTPPAVPSSTASEVSAMQVSPGSASEAPARVVQPGSAAPVENVQAREPDVEDDTAVADKPPEIPVSAADEVLAEARISYASVSFLDEDPAERNSQLYFGVGTMGSHGGLQQWAPGAEPVLVSPSVDPDIKLSALEGRSDPGAGGETVAGKGDASRLESPADRLGLKGKPRAKAEKCLADAVYFEARGEPLRGQEAVAQVVMNRVFSGYYPNNVCGVVYQNSDRHLACQFTFACEGKDLDRIDEPDMWEQAKRIARETLDGKIWLTEVGHATHYHAYWVHPSWVHEMAKLYKLGVHTFYRPRAWGDGADAPIWGNAPNTPRPEAAKSPAPAATSSDNTAKIPEAAASHAAPADAEIEATAKL